MTRSPLAKSTTTISLDPLILKIDNFVDSEFAALILKEAKYSGKTNVTRFRAPFVNDYVLNSAEGKLEKIHTLELNISKIINLPLNHQKYLQVTCVKQGYNSIIKKYSYRSFDFDKNELVARSKIRENVQNPTNLHFASIILFLVDVPADGMGAIAFKPTSEGLFDCRDPINHIIGKRSNFE